MEPLWQKLTSLALSHSRGKRPGTKKTGISLPASIEALIRNLTGDPGTDPGIYLTAFTHRSVTHDWQLPAAVSNQRLEFLGDTVLDLIISEYLYRAFPESDEGTLSSSRAKIVNRKALAAFAQSMGLGEHLIIGESADDDRIRSSESALADVFESLTGAIYLDKGLEAARSFVMKQVIEHDSFKTLVASEQNYKSRLIEYTQSHHIPPPFYTVVAETGAEHEKIFTVEVACADYICGKGSAPRKKDAEQLAAKEAIEILARAAEEASRQAR